MVIRVLDGALLLPWRCCGACRGLKQCREAEEKKRKKCARLEHGLVLFLANIYRDNSIHPSGERVMEDGEQVKESSASCGQRSRNRIREILLL